MADEQRSTRPCHRVLWHFVELCVWIRAKKKARTRGHRLNEACFEEICFHRQNEEINSMRPCFPWALFFFFHPARITSIRKHVDTAMSHAIAGDTHSLCWIRAKEKRQQKTWGHCLNEACLQRSYRWHDVRVCCLCGGCGDLFTAVGLRGSSDY